MSQEFIIRKSSRKDKKYMVRVGNRTIHFGQEGYSDYTKHKDPERKERYIKRHRKREKWGKSGIGTAGFWSRWILWNEPTLRGSIADTEERFGIDIRRGR